MRKRLALPGEERTSAAGNLEPDALKRRGVVQPCTAGANSLKVLFVHDHMFTRGRAGEVWTGGAMPSSKWQRFLAHFGSLTVVGRDGGEVESNAGFARSDAQRVAFRLFPDVNKLKNIWKRWEVRRELGRIVASSDAVVVRLPSELGLMASALAHRRGKVLLTEVAGSASISLRHYGTWITWLYAPISDWRMRRAVGTSPFVTYVTRAWLQSIYPSSSPPPGTDPTRAQSAIPDAVVQMPDPEVRTQRATRLASIGAGRALVFGTIGTLRGRYKGLQFAIPAFAKLRREGFEFTYRILGAGDHRPWQALIDENGLSDCCFLDGVRPSGQPVLEWLDGIDVHVQPSLSESLGRGTIEALSRGVACLASSAGGLSEYLDHRWLHPPGDIDALAAHLRLLMTDRVKVADLSEDAFAIARRFDPEDVERARRQLLEQFATAVRRAD